MNNWVIDNISCINNSICYFAMTQSRLWPRVYKSSCVHFLWVATATHSRCFRCSSSTIYDRLLLFLSIWNSLLLLCYRLSTVFKWNSCLCWLLSIWTIDTTCTKIRWLNLLEDSIVKIINLLLLLLFVLIYLLLH